VPAINREIISHAKDKSMDPHFLSLHNTPRTDFRLNLNCCTALE